MCHFHPQVFAYFNTIVSLSIHICILKVVQHSHIFTMNPFLKESFDHALPLCWSFTPRVIFSYKFLNFLLRFVNLTSQVLISIGQFVTNYWFFMFIESHASLRRYYSIQGLLHACQTLVKPLQNSSWCYKLLHVFVNLFVSKIKNEVIFQGHFTLWMSSWQNLL
jgi:hypothetical protein